MVGYFGDIIFETSDERILSFTNFKRSTSSNFTDHTLINQKPMTEFVSPGLDEITFTVVLDGRFGVSVKKEMDRWLEKARFGDAETLCVGVPLGVDKWTVRSVSQSWDVIYYNGVVTNAKVDITLKEYCTVMWKTKRMVIT